jgi:hypothetical protein
MTLLMAKPAHVPLPPLPPQPIAPAAALNLF